MGCIATNKKLRKIVISQYIIGKSMQQLLKYCKINSRGYYKQIWRDRSGKSLPYITERERRARVKICRTNRSSNLRQI